MATIEYRKDRDGNLKKNGDGSISFYFRVYLGEDANGKHIMRSGNWRAPAGMRLSTAQKRAAEEALRFEDSVKGIPSHRAGKVLFSQLVEMYAEDTDLKPMTKQNYQWTLTRIIAEFGHYPVEKITGDMLKRFYKKLREPGQNKNKLRAKALPGLKKLRNERNLSTRAVAREIGFNHNNLRQAEAGENVTYSVAEKTAKFYGKPVTKLFEVFGDDAYLSDTSVWQHHKVLSTFLEYAKSEGLIETNPGTTLRNPPKRPKSKVKCLTDDEAKRFVALLLEEKDIRIKAALLLAIFTGMRRGELAGLSFRDIIKRQNGYVIAVARASQYTKKTRIITTTTKTDEIRVIEISEELANFLLVEYRGWWNEQRQFHGADTPESIWKGDEDERLFIKEDGSPIFPSTLYQWLQIFLKRNNFERVSLHSMRHTNIALLILQGLDVKTVQSRSGHARTSPLLDTYAYFFESGQSRAVAALDSSLLGGAQISSSPETVEEDDKSSDSQETVEKDDKSSNE